MVVKALRIDNSSRRRRAASLRWLGAFLLLDVVLLAVAPWTIAPVLVTSLFAVIAVGVVAVTASLDSPKSTAPAFVPLQVVRDRESRR